MKRHPDKLDRIGILANSGKTAAQSLVREAARLIVRSGRQVLTDPATQEMTGIAAELHPDARSLARHADLLLVFGGDGTMLRVARETAGTKVFLLGVNLGGLGFLTDVKAGDLAKALQLVWDGDFHIEKRALLDARGVGRGQSIHTTALNDIVVSRVIVSRLIEVEVNVDGEALTNYRCDGLIVSSPTGSTAYSLAAGGAVVCPNAEVFTVTPICPHTLSNRSVIVNLASTIEVVIKTEKPETILSADGRNESELTAGDKITIRRSRHSFHLVRLPGSSFFETLRHKLNWSGTNIMTR